MRGVDRGKGHLRVGPVLVDWKARTHPENPRIDGAVTMLARVDHEAEAKAWREAFAYLCSQGARPTGFDRAVDDFDRVEQWARWALEAGPSRARPERYNGLQIRVGQRHAITVGLRGVKRMPNPAQWRPGALYRRARWIMAGRPTPVPKAPSGHDGAGSSIGWRGDFPATRSRGADAGPVGRAFVERWDETIRQVSSEHPTAR